MMDSGMAVWVRVDPLFECGWAGLWVWVGRLYGYGLTDCVNVDGQTVGVWEGRRCGCG